MIIVKIFGGFGNQLFQYACARALSIKTGAPFFMDLSSFRRPVIRLKRRPIYLYQLDQYSIVENKYRGSNFFIPVRRYCEKSFAHDETVLNFKDGVFLEGYWQSPRYFEAIAALLQQDLVYKNPLSSSACLIEDQIRSTCSVGLHFRRGDYLSPPFNRVFPVMPISYYQEAVERLARQFENLHLFVFSNDQDWAQDHVKFSHPTTYIRPQLTQNPLEDFELLRICKHTVISNSSFSWWAAWLNQNPEKQVFSPKTWLKTDPNATRDLIPSSWTLLDVSLNDL